MHTSEIIAHPAMARLRAKILQCVANQHRHTGFYHDGGSWPKRRRFSKWNRDGMRYCRHALLPSGAQAPRQPASVPLKTPRTMKTKPSKNSCPTARDLRQAARQKFKGVQSVTHLLPRAYCVAKPADHCAVFAVPPQDREQQVRTKPFVTVQNPTAEAVQLGDWCSLAYVSTETSGAMQVIFHHRTAGNR